MSKTEKDPRDYFAQALACPRTANGNTRRVLVVYQLTDGVQFVHALEYQGSPTLALAEWAGGDTRAWDSRLGECLGVPAKVAKEYLERSRRMELQAIDASTRTIVFTRDCATVLPPDNGKDGIAQAVIAFKRGEQIDVTDMEVQRTGAGTDGVPGIATFGYRGFLRSVPRGAFVVTS